MARLPLTHVLVFFNDSKHAAGVCFCTILTRTHVQLGLSCQQLLLKVQHKVRFTLQHVYSHAENLGNECADHAAALGAFCLVSQHNLSTRWARHSFDSASCCATLEMFWKKCMTFRTEHVAASRQQTRIERFVPHRATRWLVLLVPSSSCLFLVHSLGSIVHSLHD